MFDEFKGEQRMNRLNGIKLLAVLVGICLVTATVADAAVLEYRLLINGADVDTYSGAAGDITVSIEARTVDNVFAPNVGGKNYVGGLTQYAINLIDSTGIEAGSILEPKEYIDVIVPGVIENPTGTWDSATVGDLVSNHTRGKINGVSQAGSDIGTAYDVAAEYSFVPNGSLGANSMTFGGGAIDEPGTTGNWAEVASGQFAYSGGEGTLTLTAFTNEQLLYQPASLPNPESVVGDIVTFGAVVANETPTVALPDGDVVEGDWSTELGYNNPAHSVQVSAVGDDADGDPLTYEWTMMKPGGGSKVLVGETGATLTLTIAEIESLGLPAWVGAGDPSYNWTLSVTANDGTDTSVPAQIGVFVPEPTTMGLLGFGVLALLKRRRRA